MNDRELLEVSRDERLQPIVSEQRSVQIKRDCFEHKKVSSLAVMTYGLRSGTPVPFYADQSRCEEHALKAEIVGPDIANSAIDRALSDGAESEAPAIDAH